MDPAPAAEPAAPPFGRSQAVLVSLSSLALLAVPAWIMAAPTPIRRTSRPMSAADVDVVVVSVAAMSPRVGACEGPVDVMQC